MTAIADARTKLHAALAAASGIAPWRVHRTSPTQIAAPCVYLDAVELGVDTALGAGIVITTFPIYVVHDGAVRAQIEQLDDVLAHVWTAAVGAGAELPGGSRPTSLDVGGPHLRAHVLRAEMIVAALTLCAPTLVTTAEVSSG